MSRPDPLLSADGVSYALADGRPLLSEVTLAVGRERTALVAPNGAGKSTLLRLLVGELAPTAGRVLRRGRVGWLPQRLPDDPSVPLAVALGIGERLAALDRLEAGHGTSADLELVGAAWDLRERAAALLDRLGLGHLSLDRPLARVSGGEGTRVALAGVLLAEPDVLLLDEPTNHLDADARAAVHDVVRAWTGGLVVASHDRALLALVDRIVELRGGRARVYGGAWAAYAAERAAEDAAASRELDAAEDALRRTRRELQAQRERQARRDARGRRDAATANMPKILLGMRRERSQATGARLGAVAERREAEERARVAEARARVEERLAPAIAIGHSGVRADQVVAELVDVTVRHDGASAPALDGLSLLVRGPARIHLAGPNGSGKSSLLHLLAGHLAPTAGRVRLGVSPDAVALLDQHAAALDPARSVLENCRAAHPERDEGACRATLARFLFRGDAALAPVWALSGGERLRAALACALGGERAPALLLLDEPTNHLDLDGVAALERALAEYDGALVLVSHDAAFVEAVGVERTMTLAVREAAGVRTV